MGRVASGVTRIVTAAAVLFTFLVLMDSAIVALSSPATVNIYNQVGGTIRLHCKSKDDDLGEHTLLDGQHFGWGFTPNFWGTTLYYCDFVWGAKTAEGVVVYDDGSTKLECTHCVWQVHKDGFWVTEDGVVPFTFVAPWK